MRKFPAAAAPYCNGKTLQKEGKYTSAGRQGLAVVHTFRAGGEKSLNIFLFRA